MVNNVVPTMNMDWQNHLMQTIFKQSFLEEKWRTAVPGFHGF